MSIYINRITLGVSNIERATVFYDNWLGIRHEKFLVDCALYRLDNVLLMFTPLRKLADEAETNYESEGFSGVVLSRNMNSEEEVDQVLCHAQDIGGYVTKRASRNTNDIYSGYVSDLDGHLWEVLFS